MSEGGKEREKPTPWRSRREFAVVFAACTLLALALVGAAVAFGDGTHRVGKDIKAGTYRTRTGSDLCYWERLKGFSGSLNAIIANGNESSPAIVTIKPTDKGFQTSGCADWSRNLSRITKSKTRFGEGTYIVKVDITPGTYRTRGGDNCYWARLRSFEGTLQSIIANDNPRGSAIVTISKGDRGFKSSGCGTWSRS